MFFLLTESAQQSIFQSHTATRRTPDGRRTTDDGSIDRTLFNAVLVGCPTAESIKYDGYGYEEDAREQGERSMDTHRYG